MSVVIPRLVATVPFAVTLLGAGDPRSSRLVYAMVIGLLVVGLGLMLLGVWIIRQTRADLEVLAPLERMGDGDWKKKDPSTQRRMLDEVRPEGAVPLTPEPMPPPIDDEFEAEQPVSSFSDLGPGVAAEHRDPTPLHVEVDQFLGVVPIGGDEEGSIEEAPQVVDGEQTTDHEAVGAEQTTDDEAVGAEQTTDDEAVGIEQTTDDEAVGIEQTTDDEAVGAEQTTDDEAVGAEQTTDDEAVGTEQTTDDEAVGIEQTTDDEVSVEQR